MPPDTQPPNKPRGSWFYTAFLSLFLLIGLGCLLFAPVKLVKTAMFVAKAETTTGTVIDFHASRGSKSTTYAPEVTFTAPDGRTVQFRSQVSGSSTSYSIGETVPVYFDPSNPATAEINGFIPLWMPVIIFSAIGFSFSAAGGGFLYIFRKGARKQQLKAEAMQRGLSDWQSEPEWGTNGIRSETRKEMWFFWLFAIVWNAIGQPSGFICLQEVLQEDNRLAIIGLLFPLVGFFLLYVAIRKTLQVRRFGEIVLAMDPYPGSLGGDIGGTVDVPVEYRPENVFSVSLSCFRIVQSRDGNRQELIWQENGRGLSTNGRQGTRVSFRFPVPESLPPSDESPAGTHQWNVRLTADLPGVDLDRDFVIPVVKTVSPQRSSLSVEAAAAIEPVKISPGLVNISRSGDRVVFSYPRRRNVKGGLAVGAAGGWFLFFTYLFAVKAGWMAAFILPFFGIAGAGLVLCGIWWLGNSLEVSCTTGELVAVRRFLGVPVQVNQVATADIRAIEPVRIGSIGAGSGSKLIFSLKLRHRDGTSCTVGDAITGRAQAEALARMIDQGCGRGTASGDPIGGVRQAVSSFAAEKAADGAADAGSMICPKCGFVQPVAEACSSCQVIIAKYLRRREMLVEGTGGPVVSPRRTGYCYLGLLLFLIAAGAAFGWYWRGGEASVPEDPHFFRSQKYHFSMQVPQDWKILTVKEAIFCAELRDNYADRFLLLASPTTPGEILLSVSIAGFSLDSFREWGWDGFVGEINGRHPVRYTDVRMVNGLNLHRVGYEVAGVYREDLYFETDGKLIEVYFYLPIAAASDERVSTLRKMLDDNLKPI